jgi:hypothetical protein
MGFVDFLLDFLDYDVPATLIFFEPVFTVCGEPPTVADTRSARHTINSRSLHQALGGNFEAQ